VVGATHEDAPQLVERLPHSLVLAPGIGAQGATFADLAARFAGAKQRVLPSVSRALLARGPDERALRKAITEHCSAAAEALS
jgi:orotidine-5'-phosphate decarboxylase